MIDWWIYAFIYLIYLSIYLFLFIQKGRFLMVCGFETY